MQEVVGSTPIGSITSLPAPDALFIGHSRQAPESLGLEMPVKRERRTHAHPAHDHEASTVHQTEESAPTLQEHLDRRLMSGLIDPHNSQDGDDILLENPQSLCAQPALNQGRSLNQDIIAAYQGRVGLDQAFPDGFSGVMA
jgi:hypothetical protein